MKNESASTIIESASNKNFMKRTNSKIEEQRKSTIQEVEPSESHQQPEPSPRINNKEKQKEEVEFKQCEDKDRPVRLFVGQVPESMIEPHIIALFDSKNIKLLDVAVIRDKHTGRHRHCAFITVPNRDAADLSIKEFHNRKYLETMANPMQVREANQPKSKAAYAKLKEYSRIIGTAMPVFADSDVDSSAKEKASKSYHFRMSPPGLQQHVMTFNPFFSGPYFQQVPAQPFVYGYFPSPMPQHYLNVQPYQQNIEHIATHKSNYSNEPTHFEGSTEIPYGSNTYSPSGYTQYNQFSEEHKYRTFTAPSGTVYFSPSGEAFPYYGNFAYAKNNYSEGPVGANLFVNNLPPNFTDDQLKSVFCEHGSILSCKVFIDKYTNQSKGFGFVSFSNPQEAQEAIREKHGFEIEENRTIVVEFKRSGRYNSADHTQ